MKNSNIQITETVPPYCATFFVDGNPIIYDEIGGRLCVLNVTSGFIWQHLFQRRSRFQLENHYAEHFNISLKTARKDVADILSRLSSMGFLGGEQSLKKPTSRLFQVKQPEPVVSLPSFEVQSVTCRFFGKYIRLCSNLTDFSDRIFPSLAHLTVAADPEVNAEQVGVFKKNGVCQLVRNGVVDTENSNLDMILNRFKPVFTEACHADLDWVATIHCAAVKDDAGVIIMPGGKGVGKSTLCGALAKSGYDFVTDDVGVLSLPDMTLSVSPFPITLKQGSWKYLEPLYPLINCLPVYTNGLGQKIRYIFPGYPADQPGGVIRAVILPSYNSDGINRLDQVTTLEAIEVFTSEGGFETDTKKIEKFIQWLHRVPKYALSFSSLENATLLIKGV